MLHVWLDIYINVWDIRKVNLFTIGFEKRTIMEVKGLRSGECNFGARNLVSLEWYTWVVELAIR